MADIQKLSPNDPNYEMAKDTKKFKTQINYKELATLIMNSKSGEIIQVKVPRKSFYTSIKNGLAKRKLVFGEDYDMSYRTQEEENFVFITVKG